ncbi:MAG: carboxypeptidase-like regulatory domain-containing protein [Calditrichae bacterium]|nr:carboxypeptidase-like regulatory domain-containing protein [Calditrichia bacterium]
MSLFKQLHNGRYILLLLLLSPILYGQHTIRGTVRDGESGTTLAAANIQIDGTFSGTITNDNGGYILDLPELPATLTVSYIGYATRSVRVTAQTGEMLDISLTPVLYELSPILVTDEDPAVNIMRKVIEKKREWRARLNTYIADAYTRQLLENDSGIVSISESVSEAFWDREKGSREVIKSKRQTENLSSENNFAAASYIANFYDDDIEIQGFRVIGPTHPDALKHYDFKLVGRRHRDDRVVYDISLEPKSKLQTAFVGRIAVLDEVYAMIAVDLKPSESLIYPPPIQEWNVHYRQQFSNFGQDFWLPVDVRIEGRIKFGIIGLSFPAVGYRQISRLTDYRVNVPLPDSLYRSDDLLRVDSSTIAAPFRAEESEIIPLSREEELAYREIDSTRTFAKAFKPSGPLARFVDIEDDDNQASASAGSSGSVLTRYLSYSPQLWYHRVDGTHLGLKISTPERYFLQFYAEGGYKFDLERSAYGGGIRLRAGKQQPFIFDAGYHQGSQPRYRGDNASLLLNSYTVLTGDDDFYDYYWNAQFHSAVSYRLRKLRATVTLGFSSEDHRSLAKTTDYALLNPGHVQPPNPAIPEGVLRAGRLTVAWGDDYVPFGIVGQNRARLEIEHSDPALIASDFSFTRYHLTADVRLSTFFRRRILPNVIDLHLVAGTSSGGLPPQRYGVLEPSSRWTKSAGTFKTLLFRPYEGERYLGIFWEHNFRTVPLEILGLHGLARKGIGMIVFGASGRTWISDAARSRLTYTPRVSREVHHELGFSVNGILNLLRVDAVWRLDRPGFYAGFGLARIF